MSNSHSHSPTSTTYGGANPNASPYSNTTNNSNNGNSSNYKNYNNSNIIPSSRRPDGSYREEIKVRNGYINETEQSKSLYVPPPARTNLNSFGSLSYGQNYSSPSSQRTSHESVEDRVDSWGDVEEEGHVTESKSLGSSLTESVKSPLIEVNNETDSEIKVRETSSPLSTSVSVPVTAINTVIDTNTVIEEVLVREPPKPSQLATAIDTAIDATVLNNGEGSVASTSTTNRPMGRFAAQIANGERFQYRRYDNYGSSYQSSNRDSTGDNNNNNLRDFRENSRLNSSNYNNTSTTWNRSTSSTGFTPNFNETPTIKSSSNENLIETEFKTFLEELTGLRREMAIINAKLEYIRYMKARDSRELSEIEKERLQSESVLLNRIDAIYELIDSTLSNK